MSFSTKRKEIFWATFFILFWLLPASYYNLIGRNIPGIPAAFGRFYKISRLFYWRMESWPAYYLQILPESSSNWVNLPEQDYFRMQPFGYRSRLTQLINMTSFLGSAMLVELAMWLRDRWETEHPDQTLLMMRLVAFYYPTKQGPHFPGRWKPPEAPPAGKTVVLFSYDFKNGQIP